MTTLDERIALADAEAAELAANTDLPLSAIEAAAEAERIARIAARTQAVREAQARAAELRAQAERRDAAIEAHKFAEQAEAKRVTTAAKTLASSRDDLAKATSAAVAALQALWDAGQAHDALVAQTARELRAAGLPARYQDGDITADFETGGGEDGAVVLKGAWWVRVTPTWLVRWATYGALRSRIGEQMAERRAGLAGLTDAHLGGLLDKAPLPAPATYRPWWADTHMAPLRVEDLSIGEPRNTRWR